MEIGPALCAAQPRQGAVHTKGQRGRKTIPQSALLIFQRVRMERISGRHHGNLAGSEFPASGGLERSYFSAIPLIQSSISASTQTAHFGPSDRDRGNLPSLIRW